MKKQLFSLVMMFVLVIVASTVMAQTSVTPYAGGTYSYSMTGIDNVANARTARVFVDNGATNSTPELAFGTTHIYSVTSVTGAVTSGTNYFDIAVPANTTALNFNVAYDPLFATGAYQLYVVLYNGAETTCYNFIYTNITVTANNFNLVAAAPTVVCQTINSAPGVDTPASSGQNTVFTYTVTKTGGDNNDDWSFDFKIPSNTLGLDVANISSIVPSITTGTGTNTVAATGSITAGTYNVKVTNSDTGNNASVVTITITVPTTTGVADAAFVATASAAKLYVNQTSTVSIATETSSADNSATVTLKNLPTIGSFSGL